MENEIYVVCWFDGNEAIAMAGTRNSEGKVSPLAVERRPSLHGSITNGVIAVNDENRKTFSDLSRCVANLLTTTFTEPYSVRGLYVAAMPRSMRSVTTSGEKTLETRRYVTDRDIEECRTKAYDDAAVQGDVLTLFENGFDLDGSSTRHASGEVAKKLKMNALSVIATKRFSADYRMLLPKEVNLVGVLPASVAAAMAVTTSDERFEGVLSVHFCNSTTLFTLYRDDRVLATCVVPFGEEDVIHDLCTDVCSNTRDNVWRKIYGKWDFVSTESDLKILDGSGNSLINADKVEHMRFYAETRIAEIYNIGLDWLRSQVKGLDDVMKNVVFSGLITDKTGFDTFARNSLAPDLNCRLGNANAILLDHKYDDDPDYIPMIGSMLMASLGCVEVKQAPLIHETAPRPSDDEARDETRTRESATRKDKKSKLGFISDLFGGKEDADL